MRVFDHFNTAGEKPCPVCGTQDDKETVLVPIAGTEDDGIMEAAQVHLECINLSYIPAGGLTEDGVFIQVIRDE